MDLAKYRALFLEEASEHLSEMSRGLLALEKTPDSIESLDLVFRMAHSIKGMASSIGYDAIAGLAHRLEDAIGAYRSRGSLDGPEAAERLFRGLEGLERMVAEVRASGGPPASDSALEQALQAAPEAGSGPPKKVLR